MVSNVPKVAIVNSSSFGRYFTEHIERLESFAEVIRLDLPADIPGIELAEKLRDVDFIIASVTPNYDAEFFKHVSNLKLIARHGIGYNNIDLDAATRCGVIVTKVPGEVERNAVAEHALALLMAVSRKIVDAVNAVRAGKWAERARFIGIELTGKVVGVIGVGNIGSRFCQIVSRGFNATVLGYDPGRSEEWIRSAGAEPVSDLDELLERADIISLHASLNETSYHILSRPQFAKMKDGVIIVDTARGELIDTQALIEALESGKVRAVALDVVEGEPIGAEHPLLKYDNVIIVPHIAAYTEESLKAMGDKVIADIEAILDKRVPEEVVNSDVLKKWDLGGMN